MERAFFDADSAARAEFLGYNRLVILPKYYGFVPCPDHRAVFVAFVCTLFGLASVPVENCYTHITPKKREKRGIYAFLFRMLKFSNSAAYFLLH
jgi:hypothetical protein